MNDLKFDFESIEDLWKHEPNTFLALAVCQIKVAVIAGQVGISKVSLFEILQEDLQMSKALARWIPKLQNEENLTVLSRDKDFYRDVT